MAGVREVKHDETDCVQVGAIGMEGMDNKDYGGGVVLLGEIWEQC